MVDRRQELLQPGKGGVLFVGGMVPDRDQMAFAHALRMAEAVKTSLTVLECGQGPAGNFPVRQRLEQWGLLPEGSRPQDVGKLGFWVRKSRTQETNPRRAVLAYLRRQPIRLLVMANHGRSGLLKLGPLDPSAADSRAAALFVTPSSRGFVDPRTGAIHYRKILIPVARDPDPDRAVRVAVSLAGQFAAPSGTFVLLHVGDRRTRPEVSLPECEGWSAEWLVRPGQPVETIRAVAAEIDSDLVVMTTAGRKGFLEALTGSTVEQVVTDAPCPVLAVPAEL